MHGLKVMYLGSVCYRGDLGFLNCNSLYVNLKYNEIFLTFTAGSYCFCGVCILGVVLGLSVLSW